MYLPDEAIQIFNEGGGTDDIVRRRIKNKIGQSASSRTARRWKQEWRKRGGRVLEVPLNSTEETKTNYRRIPSKRVLFKGAVFDLETTDFNTAGFQGHLVCACVLPLDSDEIQTVQIEFNDHKDDRRVLKELIDLLSGYDLLIGHNIASFDLGWLDSRRMFYGWPSLRSWYYFDTYQVSCSLAIKAGSKRLGWLGDYFGLEGEKTAVYPTSWHMVSNTYEQEYREARQEIVYHCQQDVKSNRNLLDVLFPEALTLKNCQIKQTKWATGIPR